MAAADPAARFAQAVFAEPELSDALYRFGARGETLTIGLGEGFRMHDLKRWGLGMTRGVSQNAAMTHTAYDKVSVESGNFRFLWPIPKSEMDANPQFKGQQNAGF